MKRLTLSLVICILVAVAVTAYQSGGFMLETGGKLGFNTLNPSADVHHVAVSPVQHTGRFTSTDGIVDHVNSFAEFENTGSERKNQVFYTGWNLAPGGGLMIPGQAANGLSFESYYAPGNDSNGPYSESHLFHVTPQGIQRRPWSFVISQQLNDGIGAINIGDFRQRDITGNVTFSQISASSFTVFVPTTLRGDLRVQNPNDHSVQLFKVKTAANGTDPVLVLGQNDTGYPTVEVGQASPAVIRRGGSLYLQTSASLKSDTSPAWGYDHYLGWQRIALGGNFLDDVTMMNSKQVLFSSSGWYGARDAGIQRVSAGRIKVTNGGAGSGTLEAGMLYLNDGTVKQVTFGPVDSGGSGYKMLRVAN